jgi:DNA replication and repair protein RecF
VYLESLYLKNFRNYKEAQAHLGMRLNVFYGNNAQGKTNLLEAIYLIATGRSFRTQHLQELIHSGESFFFLEAKIVKDQVSQTIKLSFDGQNKRLQINGSTYSHFQPLLGLLPSVLYTPNDTELINGSPSIRRRFLNLHLAQSDPIYVHHLTRYWRAMKQRNALLRSSNRAGIECFENEMAQSASYLWKARSEMIEELKAPLVKQSNKLSGSKELHELELQAVPKAYLQQLQKNRARETALGFTLTGPHRDDLTLFIDQKPAKTFASEGQKKTSIAALKLAEWERLSARSESLALMAIDDLGLHLDNERLSLLNASLLSLGQVFITTPHVQLEKANYLHIEDGLIR